MPFIVLISFLFSIFILLYVFLLVLVFLYWFVDLLYVFLFPTLFFFWHNDMFLLWTVSLLTSGAHYSIAPFSCFKPRKILSPVSMTSLMRSLKFSSAYYCTSSQLCQINTSTYMLMFLYLWYQNIFKGNSVRKEGFG